MDPAVTDRSGLGPADVLASDGSAHTEFPESRLDPPSTTPSVPVHVRNVALVVLAVIACIAVLHWAAAVIVPLLLGIVFSYALTPVVNRFVSWRLPRPLAAALLLLAIVGGAGAMTWRLSDDAMSLVQAMPEAAQKLRRGIERTRESGNGSTIDRVQQAAAELQKATEAAPATPPTRGVTKVQIEKPKFAVTDYLWTGTLGLAAIVAQAYIDGVAPVEHPEDGLEFVVTIGAGHRSALVISLSHPGVLKKIAPHRIKHFFEALTIPPVPSSSHFGPPDTSERAV